MSFSLKYLGHSCVLIESCRGKKIILDPFLTGNQYAAIKPEDITELDVILVSHGAHDHLGDTVSLAKRTGATVYCGPDVYDYCVYHGVDKQQLCGMVWGTYWDYKGVTLRSVEAKHISYFPCGDVKITGIPMSFIITLEDGTGIYFSADTAIFSDMKFFGQLYPVKYGFFCMGNFPGLAFEMDGKEAALAASLFDVEVAFPIHCPPDSPYIPEFKEELSKLSPKTKAVALQPGESYSA